MQSNSEKMSQRALQLKKSYVVLSSMVARNVRNQYRRSVLGIVWTVLNPLLNMLVMSFVFSNIFGRDGIDMDYSVYVLSGTIAFAIMRTATNNAMHSLVNSYDLMTKTRTPYYIFPLSHVFSALVNFGFSLIALIIVMLVRYLMGADVTFSWTMFMVLIPWLPCIFMFTTGLSLILSVIYVRFRDIGHIYGVLLTLWNYLTPVFYSLKTLQLGDTAMKIMKLNPMLHYVNYFRDVINGVVPDWKTHLACFGAGVIMLLLGLLIFKLAKRSIILYI